MTRPRQSLLNVVNGRRSSAPPYEALQFLSIFVPGSWFAFLGKWVWAAFWFVAMIATYLAEDSPVALRVPEYGFNAVYVLYYLHLVLSLYTSRKADVEAEFNNRRAYVVIIMVFSALGVIFLWSSFSRTYKAADDLAMACDSTIIGQQGLVHKATGRLLSFAKLKARPYFKTACLDPNINVIENVPSTLTTYDLTVWSSQGTRKFTSQFPYPARR